MHKNPKEITAKKPDCLPQAQGNHRKWGTRNPAKTHLIDSSLTVWCTHSINLLLLLHIKKIQMTWCIFVWNSKRRPAFFPKWTARYIISGKSSYSRSVYCCIKTPWSCWQPQVLPKTNQDWNLQIVSTKKKLGHCLKGERNRTEWCVNPFQPKFKLTQHRDKMLHIQT